MKKALLILLSASSLFFMAKCSPKASKNISSAPVESKEQIMAHYSATQLESGKTIFMNSCAKCHKLKQPETRNPEQWDKVLKRMIPKAKLGLEEGKLVRAYLIANSKQG